MKALVCELCGGNELVKEDGLYRCMHCGTRYTTEEAKKLIVEGTVKIDGIPTAENLLKRAREYALEWEVRKAEEYCNKVLDIDADNIESRQILQAMKAYRDAPNVLMRSEDPKKNKGIVACKINGQLIMAYGIDSPAVLKLKKGKYDIEVNGSNHVIEIKDELKRYYLEIWQGTLVGSSVKLKEAPKESNFGKYKSDLPSSWYSN